MCETTGNLREHQHVYSMLRRVLLSLGILLVVMLAMPNRYVTIEAQAANYGTINCRLSDATRIVATANVSAKNLKKIKGKKVYLLMLYTGKSNATKAKVVAKANKKSAMTLVVKKSKGTIRTMIQNRFALAMKSGRKYKLISAPKYVVNPGLIAANNYAFPTTLSKKGLQAQATMMEDVEELNVQHSVVNMVLTDMIAASGENNSGSSIAYRYNGKTYWYRRSVVSGFDSQIKKMTGYGTLINAVLLVRYRADLKNLLPSKARKAGHNFYAWNVSDKNARQTLEAAVSFLANRYSPANSQYGRVSGWIVGNEVANYNDWNYAGKLSLSKYAKLYADTFRMVYNAVTSVYANARVYISLDCVWNMKRQNAFTSREMLTKVVQYLNAEGAINWNLAYHPYNMPLTDPYAWNTSDSLATSALTSPVITMKNLTVLTNFIRTNYGSSHRVILSEQGFTSKIRTTNDRSIAQAASIAYSYYLTETNDMVDSFIMNRHVDHMVEVKQGLSLGLWTTSGTEWASEKKDSWNIFKYMDTNLSEKVTSTVLWLVGTNNWANVVPGYSASTMAKINITQGQLTPVQNYALKGRLPGKWTGFGAVSSEPSNSATTAVSHHENGANSNRPFGFAQNFNNLNLSASPVLATTVTPVGAAGTVTIMIRVYAGKKNVYECTQNVASGRATKLAVSLSSFGGIRNISRIEIMATSSRGWKGKSTLTIADTGVTVVS